MSFNRNVFTKESEAIAQDVFGASGFAKYAYGEEEPNQYDGSLTILKQIHKFEFHGKPLTVTTILHGPEDNSKVDFERCYTISNRVEIGSGENSEQLTSVGMNEAIADHQLIGMFRELLTHVAHELPRYIQPNS
jgi:hypothetical protein